MIHNHMGSGLFWNCELPISASTGFFELLIGCSKLTRAIDSVLKKNSHGTLIAWLNTWSPHRISLE
jgi:hypothetical protein